MRGSRESSSKRAITWRMSCTRSRSGSTSKGHFWRRRVAARLLVVRVGDQVHVVVVAHGGRAGAAPQQVEREVVRDAEQPALGIVDGPVRGLERAHEGILHDVLGVEHGADHARAIAVQPGAQAFQVERQAGPGHAASQVIASICASAFTRSK